jgi:6-phosphogluconolactonase
MGDTGMTNDVTAPEPILRRVADEEAVAREAADEIARVARTTVAARGRMTLALTGGSTPKRLYALLADPGAPYRTSIPWERIDAFFGDDRHVPPDHPDSNYRMARETLLDHVPMGSVHRMRGEDPAEAAATSYEAELERRFGLVVTRDPPPRFDLVLLGLGTDAHVASLFPGNPALDELQRWVVAPLVEEVGAYRITLTLPVLNAAREVLFLVAGAHKEDAMAKVFAPARGAVPPPAARVRPDAGALVWIADEAAAARVPT